MSDAQTKIDKEIDELADKVVKSTTDSKQLLLDTIMEMGPDNLKKAVSELTAEEQELFKASIEELTPKKTETPAAQMKTESQTGSDNEDENLMKEQNKEHANQGGPKDKPEGWQGEVIKSEGEKEAVKKLIAVEEVEHGKDLDGDGKIGEKLEKEKSMKKALEEIVAMAKSMNMSKEEVVKAIKECGEDMDKVKTEMSSRMEKLKARKSPMPEAAQPEKKDEPKKEDKPEPKMEKSLVWTPKNPIAAGTMGRNTHYDVDAYISEQDAKVKEVVAKGGYINDTTAEPMAKSEGQKLDINDILEKGMDYSTDEIKRIEGIQNHKTEGKIVKSFHDEDIAAALGISAEEYKKLMGD